MKKLILGAVAALLLLVPGSAQAATCSIGNSGVTYNLDGEPARFANLSAQRGMNCASARYVLNKWLRKAYSRQYSNRIPTDFYDGYVTWDCFKLSRLRWQCREYDSGTRFKFTAYRY
jgi:opacity protein-like surface antigen